MRRITLDIALTDDKVATAVTLKGFKHYEMQDHLLIVGILENLKADHLSRIRTLFEQTQVQPKKDK